MVRYPWEEKNYVDASPVKSFFVEMLTRDIELEDAILDLMDNSVDGILRQRGNVKSKKPYEGFFAEISFDKNSFCIHDNCGGIPWSLHEYAFRMGPEKNTKRKKLPTVGTYGIGMKRAIFKMGKNCSINTKHKNEHYEVNITPKWISDEDEWRIPVRTATKKLEHDGTTITIDQLHESISERFGRDRKSFLSNFINILETHYAVIIKKGFRVIVNRQEIIPKSVDLVFTPILGKKVPSISPYIFKGKIDGVDVFLAVGFTMPIPSKKDVEHNINNPRWATYDAGWTVICNDRVVLFSDKTELTGWGEGNIPQYHTQFIAISGVVEFKSNDASLLPTKTTKRGIEASSKTYLKVKNKMREGMKVFTDYTNKWKGKAEQSIEHMAQGQPIPLEEIKERSKNLKFTKVTKIPGTVHYKPTLPEPVKEDSDKVRISYMKKLKEVKQVSLFLFDDQNVRHSKVGETCFEEILTESKR